MWENKAILFLTDAVLSIRQVRPQKPPRAEAGARKRKIEAGARKRKIAAARQATRRCHLRQAQAEKDAGAPSAAEEEIEEKERARGRRGVGERPR